MGPLLRAWYCGVLDSPGIPLTANIPVRSGVTRRATATLDTFERWAPPRLAAWAAGATAAAGPGKPTGEVHSEPRPPTAAADVNVGTCEPVIDRDVARIAAVACISTPATISALLTGADLPAACAAALAAIRPVATISAATATSFYDQVGDAYKPHRDVKIGAVTAMSAVTAIRSSIAVNAFTSRAPVCIRTLSVTAMRPEATILVFVLKEALRACMVHVLMSGLTTSVELSSMSHSSTSMSASVTVTVWPAWTRSSDCP